MPKFDVIVMRPVNLISQVEGYNSLQDLQYIAKNISATSFKDAGTLAIAEVMSVCGKDYPPYPAEQYEVLGTFLQGQYRPWFNGNHP
jgi:hypothetical protein